MNRSTSIVTALTTVFLLGTGCTLYQEDSSSARTPVTPDHEPGEDCGTPDDGTLPSDCSVEVHVIGVYETRGDHSGGNHPEGCGKVVIERPGKHRLVLSAYEPTAWDVELLPGVEIESVHLIGYHAQTVNLEGVPVTTDTYEQGGQAACGYSIPYNGEGCDTNELLALAESRAGGEVTTFHGCYQASEWTLHANGTASSNCNTLSGYEQFDLYGTCGDGGDDPGTGEWERHDFETASNSGGCTGDHFVRYSDQYGLYVGAVLCGSSRAYKLFLSDTKGGPYLEIADYAGHGQDHCELVNPGFSIPDEDDITSGGCTECSVGGLVDLIDIPVYARAVFGEPFERVTSQEWADLTSSEYRCGVAIP